MGWVERLRSQPTYEGVMMIWCLFVAAYERSSGYNASEGMSEAMQSIELDILYGLKVIRELERDEQEAILESASEWMLEIVNQMRNLSSQTGGSH